MAQHWGVGRLKGQTSSFFGGLRSIFMAGVAMVEEAAMRAVAMMVEKYILDI